MVFLLWSVDWLLSLSFVCTFNILFRLISFTFFIVQLNRMWVSVSVSVCVCVNYPKIYIQMIQSCLAVGVFFLSRRFLFSIIKYLLLYYTLLLLLLIALKFWLNLYIFFSFFLSFILKFVSSSSLRHPFDWRDQCSATVACRGKKPLTTVLKCPKSVCVCVCIVFYWPWNVLSSQ